MNDFQKEFMQRLSVIQEKNVQSLFAKSKRDKETENLLYDLSFELITDLLTLLDGYDSEFKYKLFVMNENGENLKENPLIELHDQCEDFLKFSK